MLHDNWSGLRKLIAVRAASGTRLIEHTATGRAILFNADVEKPLKAFEIPIAVESGITGLTITHCGKNINVGLADGYWDQTDSPTYSSVWKRSQIRLPVEPNAEYTVSAAHPLSGATFFYLSDSDPIYYGNTSNTNITLTMFSNVLSIGPYIDGINEWMQVERGPQATEYEPYSGHTYTVDWSSEAGSITAGSFNAVTGLLTVTAPTAGTYQLQPVPIVTKTGINNIWTSLTGTNTIKYLAKN